MEHLENSKTNEESKDEHEERLRKSICEGCARRNREKHAILAKLEKKTDASSALVTSPAMKCTKLANKN